MANFGTSMRPSSCFGSPRLRLPYVLKCDLSLYLSTDWCTDVMIQIIRDQFISQINCA